MSERVAHVVGRGIVGLSLAYELSERGWSVVLVGPPNRPGTASRAAVGVSGVKGKVRADQYLFGLKMRGHDELPAWLDRVERLAGCPIPRQFTGVYEPFVDLTEYDRIRQRVFHSSFTGCLHVELLVGPGQYPMPAAGAFHYYRDGWYDPRALLAALEAVLRARGARWLEAPVHRILPHPDRGLILDTANGPVEARDAVLAAGIFSNEILENSGIYHLKQECVEGTTLAGAAGPHLPERAGRLGRLNLVVHGGRWLVGSTSRHQPAVAACAPSAADREALGVLARTHLGEGSTDGAAAIWGIRGRFRDRYPAAGSLFLPNSPRRLWVALGFYKNGLQLGPLFAQDLARCMTESSTFSLGAPVDVSRFRPA